MAKTLQRFILFLILIVHFSLLCLYISPNFAPKLTHVKRLLDTKMNPWNNSIQMSETPPFTYTPSNKLNSRDNEESIRWEATVNIKKTTSITADNKNRSLAKTKSNNYPWINRINATTKNQWTPAAETPINQSPPVFEPSKKLNILFLVADDMRPEIGAYTTGSDVITPFPDGPRMYTPHLDALASKSLLLKQAHVQFSLCGPSRASFLTGRRPDTTHIYDHFHDFRKVGGNFTTIPQFFKEQGYITQGIGKIFHTGRFLHEDDPLSWTEPYLHGKEYRIYDNDLSWQAVLKNMTDKYPLVDTQAADFAVEALKQLAPKSRDGTPFFLAVGFHKPHLPFQCPDEFMQYYPKENIHLPDNPFIPSDFPKIAWKTCGGLHNHKDIRATHKTTVFNTTLSNESALKVRRAYYSCISYTDSLVGRVIGELENQGLGDNTIITFLGDHGWQLGEHKAWCKNKNFEQSTHAPMMISVPGKTTTGNGGIKTDHLTEFVDLFPTLVELAGFPKLKTCPVDSTVNWAKNALCTEGSSMVPLMEDPERTDWKQRVFSQVIRKSEHRGNDVMGYSMRTTQYRYTEWVGFLGKPYYVPIWERLVGAELYDHVRDPGENVNLFRRKEYKQVVRNLSDLLHKGWRHALPTTQQ